MPTLLQDIRSQVRYALNDTDSAAYYWSDAALLEYCRDGCRDLWKAILDLYQDHLVTLDTTNVSLAADSDSLSGVPADVFRVVNLQPRTLGAASGSAHSLIFKPASLIDPNFIQAQVLPAQSPRNRVIWYAVINAGAPVGAPTIRVAPRVSSAIDLALWYNPTLPTLTEASVNPIPGESDRALIAWTIAWARGRERPDRAPDPEYISVYATEKRNCLVALTPRSVQEIQVVDAMWLSGAESSDEGW
jgi:hypothetical protein